MRHLTDELRALPRDLQHERLRELVPALSLAERFDLLHRLGVYHHAESLSGAASTLDETARLRAALPEWIAAHAVDSILDIPCGDFHWMQRVEFAGHYTGADIVPGIVERNRLAYASDRRHFVLLDATSDPLPAVDLVVCRDLFVHLGNRDVRAVLGNLVASGSRLLVTNHFLDRTENPDIESGDFRPINLCRAPFGLPQPMAAIREESALAEGLFRDRAMALWRLADIARALAG